MSPQKTGQMYLSHNISPGNIILQNYQHHVPCENCTYTKLEEKKCKEQKNKNQKRCGLRTFQSAKNRICEKSWSAPKKYVFIV